MLEAVFIIGLVLAGIAVLGVLAIPFLILGAVIWLVLLPFKLLFHLLFGGLKLIAGLIGLVLGLVALPVILLVVGVTAVGGVLLALLVPLLPIVIVGVVAWAIYQATLRPTHARRPARRARAI